MRACLGRVRERLLMCERDLPDVVVAECESPTGRHKVFCDPCLAPLVRALNVGGIPTDASCCGHGVAPADIGLADGRWLMVLTYEQMRALSSLWPDLNSGVMAADRVPDLSGRDEIERLRGRVTQLEDGLLAALRGLEEADYRGAETMSRLWKILNASA